MLLRMMLITRQQQIFLNNLLSNLCFFILSYITNTLMYLIEHYVILMFNLVI
jgi:hypothetical protein